MKIIRVDARNRMKRWVSEMLKEKAPKNPRVPTFPPSAEATAQKLREIIDAHDERFPLAYACLSRLCALWVPNALISDKMGGGQFGIVVNELVDLMTQLFPDGEGLPERNSI